MQQLDLVATEKVDLVEMVGKRYLSVALNKYCQSHLIGPGFQNVIVISYLRAIVMNCLNLFYNGYET